MKRRILWIVLSCIMFISSIGLILYYCYGNGIWFKAKTAPSSETYAEFTYPSIDQSDIDAIKNNIPSNTSSSETASDASETSEPKESIKIDVPCPVDFSELQLANPDII